MATVVNCSTGGGRMIAINTPQAIPLALSLSYLNNVSNATSVFGVQASAAVTDLLENAGINTQNATVEPLSVLGVVTQVSAQQSVIAQVQNALTGAIFVTPFGDSAGDIRISFISNRVCDTPEDDTVAAIQHYLDHRLLPTRNRGHAIIVIGTAVFRGHLLALEFSGQGGELPVRACTLIFKAWPND
jgi:hypothetical protein